MKTVLLTLALMLSWTLPFSLLGTQAAVDHPIIACALVVGIGTVGFWYFLKKLLELD